MDDPTDLALSICTGIGLFICAGCFLTSVCSRGRFTITGAYMKPSRSDPDLTNIVENAVPSGSGTRLTDSTP
jgi:hypothetical protein